MNKTNKTRDVLPIITNGLELQKENLREILSKIPDNYYLSIISMVGAFRTGKSFFLNMLLNYLEHKTINNTSFSNFKWRHGIDPHTTGINMWSEPFLFHESKVAVLLVDTQGLFDHGTSKKNTIELFGLSSLISSTVLYNTDKKIQEDDLEQISYFSEYGKLYSKQDQLKPFNDLIFLVRDWQYFEKNNCGKEYIKKVLENDSDDETRKQITNCYQNIGCYLLPHPGAAVANGTFKESEAEQIEPYFLEKTNEVLNDLFSNINIKNIASQPLLSQHFETCIVNYVEAFKTVKGPKPRTVLETTTELFHESVVSALLNVFRSKMDTIVQSCVDKEEFVRVSNDLRSQTLHESAIKINFGSEEKKKETIKRFTREVDSTIAKYNKLHELHHRKSHSILYYTVALLCATKVALLLLRFVVGRRTRFESLHSVALVLFGFYLYFFSKK